MKDIGAETKKGVFWTAFFNFFQYSIRIGSSIILARLLFPEDFGLMGIALIVVQFARRFAYFGFNMAIVQRKSITKEHIDTVFVVNLVLMSLTTLVLIAISPFLSTFFNNPKVGPIISVISFNFFLTAFSGMPTALLSRSMKFKEVGIVQTTDYSVHLITPIFLALAGFGVWSMVYGTLLGTFASFVVGVYLSGWRPGFRFRKSALNDVFSFGIWANFLSYLKYFINNVDYFFIAKLLNATMLGYYERAFNLMSIPRKNLVRRFNSVLFSAYSRLQDDEEKMLRVVHKVTSSVSVVVYPLMIWLFFAAPSFITVLYGAKWKLTIVPLQIMCLSGLLNTFSMVYHPVLLAKGVVKECTIRDLAYLIVLAISVLIGIKWGINGVASGVAFSSIIYIILNLHLVKKVLKLNYIQFLEAQKSALVYGTIQVAIIFSFKILTQSIFQDDSWQMLISISVLSVIAYFGSHLVFRFGDVDDFFKEIFSELKKVTRHIPGIKNFSSSS